MNFKKMKAPGIDNFNAELIQAGGQQVHRRLYRLVINIWHQERMPNEWSLALICPIYRKGEKLECCNYRGISLLTIVYEIPAAAINNRLTQCAEDLIEEYQNGFRNNRAATDNIYVMCQILEKCCECNIGLYFLYIDVKRAFDTVNRRLYKGYRR
jgi:sorting nexin-29